MPIYIKANLLCNFKCAYCYQHPFRPEEQVIQFDSIEKTIREQFAKAHKGKKEDIRGTPIGLHGGEPLFMGKEFVERFLALCFELTGKSAIQTNGYLIDDDYVEMFKKYKTGVGISIDGPWPCNELRGTGTLEERKTQTEKILRIIDRLKEAEVRVSLIAVIHKKNALGDRREIMKNWIVELSNKKIGGRFNPCCCGDEDIDLTPEESADFYSDMFYFMLRSGVGGWSPWKDMINSLLQREPVVCVYKSCDPYFTPSCTPVLGDGSCGVCLRLYTDGKTYLRDEYKTDIRDNVLLQTGCKDCRWWKNCYGGCIGLSIDFDWRNKDRYCLMYKTVFENIVNALKCLQIKPPKKTEKEKSRPSGGGHWDGFEHIDGDERHLDSNTGHVWEDDPRSKVGGHWDGVEHLDGENRHLDG